jgi:two-component system, cell cycle response regulator
MAGGHTTVIQRVLERRAAKPTATEEGTTATVAVMLRVLPPPKALLVFSEPLLRREMERRVTPDVLDFECAAPGPETLRRFASEFRPVLITDSLEFIRTLRAQQGARTSFVLYVAELDDAEEREAGLAAGADDCVGRRASEREIAARVGAARRVAELESVLRVTLEENRKLSATDELTRTASRRFFAKHFPRELDRAARYGRALSLVLCDIDHFRKINETLGHPGGDQILRQLASRLQQGLRRSIDWVARIGGEEFAIVMPETPHDAAREVANKLRRQVSDIRFKSDSRSVRVTASFGLCGMDRVPAGERRLAQRVLKLADTALYRSKHDGRNRVTGTLLDARAADAAADPAGEGGAADEREESDLIRTGRS